MGKVYHGRYHRRIYEFITVRWFYPGEAVVVALVLAIVPYLMLRGLVNRLTDHKPSSA